jgi:hypothetical protein
VDNGLTTALILIPLSSGVFHATSGYMQNAAVLGLALIRIGYRWLIKLSANQWLPPHKRIVFVFLAGFMIDLLYE